MMNDEDLKRLLREALAAPPEDGFSKNYPELAKVIVASGLALAKVAEPFSRTRVPKLRIVKSVIDCFARLGYHGTSKEIGQLKDKLAGETAYLEDEVRTEYN